MKVILTLVAMLGLLAFAAPTQPYHPDTQHNDKCVHFGNANSAITFILCVGHHGNAVYLNLNGQIAATQILNEDDNNGIDVGILEGNLEGGRYYLQLNTQTGTLIVTEIENFQKLEPVEYEMIKTTDGVH